MALYRFYDFHFGEGPKICLQTHISQIKDAKCRIQTGDTSTSNIRRQCGGHGDRMVNERQKMKSAPIYSPFSCRFVSQCHDNRRSLSVRKGCRGLVMTAQERWQEGR